ncbi:phosphoenolpyruvate kinase [candidate division KSB1 bacterium]|nr:phosphoenolpyruvate kinase [candidate division KSB1 bacterium]
MKTSLTPESLPAIFGELQQANEAFTKHYPGESGVRQPVHTVYGGAQLFKADAAPKLGMVALRTLQEYAPDFASFAKILGLTGAEKLPESQIETKSLQQQLQQDPEAVRQTNAAAWLAYTVYARVLEKLKREAVEDLRIDFEDGYGNRPNAEEDGHAVAAAEEMAAGMRASSLPPFIGIRIKPFTEELRNRSLRTLDLFITTLLSKTGGRLPDNFVVTLPKITVAEQVSALVRALQWLEAANGLPAGALKLEIMVETTQAMINSRGVCSLPAFVAAAEGRCLAAHFGVYDYTAACNITALYQSMEHASCDFARHIMTVALGGTGIWLSDGATNVMPVGPHRAAAGGTLTEAQQRENRVAVHAAWRLGYRHIEHSLKHGFYQGWDLHPSQIPIRYAAVYNFFLEGLAAASARLKTFVEKAAQATLLGAVFDDAATGQGLLNFFLRGLNCGAITEEEALATGLTLEEIRGKSFVKILKARQKA